MTKPAAGRVIVGVDDSPAGSAALRVAVAQAALAGRELVAVRAYKPPPHPYSTWRGQLLGWPGNPAVAPMDPSSPSWQQLKEAREQRERDAVRRAFAQAVGGIPHGVRVRVVTSMGSPGKVLVATADVVDDLLVVGKAPPCGLRRLWPWRWFQRSPRRYCAAHAVCPVLAVPGDAFLSSAAGESLHSQVLDGALDATRRAPVASPRARELGEARVWPERACCCLAPPMVKAVLPAGDRHTVDLFLCGHHYLASLGSLALADAMVTFGERSSVLSLVGRR
ncbi:universal stress protein [Streptomyces broussonetiae]|uniref:Universal stress protein n=1 Tax=Streptomyces broussonetiae TaxID=2686304 RepID=A0A6I6NCG2_9ACTN|nr:universal stress protein [Streptomyces broussonetiae]QHA09084.1 hypothetical protein GQF42_42945 [Streptomyces broussonetiae]